MPKIQCINGKLNLDQVSEDSREVIELILERFVNNPDLKEYEFPCSFESIERSYIHEKAKELGLKSKSKGKGPTRTVTVYKRDGSTIIQADAVLGLCRQARQTVLNLLATYPVSNKERTDLLPITERDRSFPPDASLRETSKNRLHNGVPIVPPPAANSELLPQRKALLIWPMKDAILQAINAHSVVIVSGETGSSKTTQVPQFIMEHAEKTGRGCRIICSVPRRISAVTAGERVALERGESIPKTVGYQIRMENKVSPQTVLTYCTHGTLLRTLLCGDSLLATVTHLVIDEVHERDRACDFALIALRDALAKYRGLKLVLMSAALDNSAFSKYFTNCPVVSGNSCPVITVPGRLYEVQEFFLEEILKKTGYMTKEMIQVKKEMERTKQNKVDLEAWTKAICDDANLSENFIPTPILGKKSTEVGPEKIELEGYLKQEMDRCLGVAWAIGTEQAFMQLLQLIFSENISVDYQHSETGLTSLMAAAARGNVDAAEHLLAMGARTMIRDGVTARTAVDWATAKGHTSVVQLLQAYTVYFEYEPCSSESEVELSEESKMLLDVYKKCYDEELVNAELILSILFNIHGSGKKGAVLIFLPGYEEILNIRERILANEKKFNEHGKLVLYILHSKMQTADQKRAFQPAIAGQRKIILSTNIAETSVTIDDVTFVIDSGRVKEKSYNTVANMYVTRNEWISQWSVRQRRSRAGRTEPGLCFHLFSAQRYRAMRPLRQPEMLREPLQDLCLQTKLLAPPNSPIADFLARAIEPPSPLVTRNSVQLLKTMDALDAWEDLTDLGRHLLEIPIEPKYGKMLLFSIILKCLDPILTIVCCLSQGELFITPNKPALRRNLASERKKLANNSFSDHMVYLRVFQGWQQARFANTEKEFCEKHFVSGATLELACAARAQVLGQLRGLGLVKARGTGDIRDVNTHSDNWPVVKATIVGGLYPNLARVDREHSVLRTQKEHQVLLHPSSVLCEGSKGPRLSMRSTHETAVGCLPTDWLAFDELARVGAIAHARACTLVSPLAVAIFAGPARLPVEAFDDPDHPLLSSVAAAAVCDSDSESEADVGGKERAQLRLDDWLLFRTDGEAGSLVYQMRLKWHTLLAKRLRNPNKPWAPGDEAVVNTLVNVLSNEEQALGLEQPQGVGQRPRPLVPDCVAPPLPHGDDGNTFQSPSIDSNRFIKPNRYPDSPTNKCHQDQGGMNGAVALSPMSLNSSSHENDNNTRYFVIKAGNLKTVDASVMRGIWAFTHNTEKKILEAYNAGKTVILVFSLQSSGHFQGYARLRGDRCEAAEPLLEQGANLSCMLPVEWIKRANISFNATRHLVNPYNENNKVQTSRDGQEIEPSVGDALCKMWDSPATGWMNKNPLHQNHQNGFPGRPIRGRPHYNSNPHFYRK